MDGWIPTHTIGRLSCPVPFKWGVSLTRPMLLPVGTFSYTPCAVLCGEIITCPSCCFTWGVFLKFPMLLYVGSFSDTPDAVLRGEFLLHTPCYLMWEDSLTCRILFYVVTFFYITHTFFLFFFWEMSLILSVLFYVGVSFTLLALFYTGSIFSMPYDIRYQEFHLHILCKFMWRRFLIVCSVFFSVKSFFDTPHAILCWTFLLQFDVQYTSLSGEFFLHTPC